VWKHVRKNEKKYWENWDKNYGRQYGGGELYFTKFAANPNKKIKMNGVSPNRAPLAVADALPRLAGENTSPAKHQIAASTIRGPLSKIYPNKYTSV
jgi:hypothetical protein